MTQRTHVRPTRRQSLTSSTCRRLLSTFALTTVLIVLFAVSSPTPASGHSASRWYGARWETRVVGWRFDEDFPTGGGIRRAVLYGSRQWNQADAGLRFRHRRGEVEAGRVDPCSAPLGRNVVDWRPIDGPGGKLAVTVVCSFGGGSGSNQMQSFHMVFDRDEMWHTDPLSLPPPFAVDVWAVASHEFGHATGRITGGPGGEGHFPERSDLCPDLLNPRRHTMCPSYDLVGVYMRTLEWHDVDTFKRAYGPR